MKDIVQRLREVTGFVRFETNDRVAAAASLSEEAACEIERLRSSLDLIRKLEAENHEMRERLATIHSQSDVSRR